MADHGRAMSMLVADGVLPANEGRGYVLRRIIRRAVRRARQLGVDAARARPRLVDAAVGVLGAAYPGLAEQHHLIVDVVGREEEGFLRTLATGSTILEEELASGAGAVSGEVAFRLHDTYGFPVELTVEIAEEAGVAVDLDGFEAAMDRQRTQARAAARAGRTVAGEEAYRSVLDTEGQTVFVGQRPDGYSAPARVVAVLADLDPDHAGQVEIFLDRTPFYAEGGGQVGDTGTIVTETGTALVYDTVSALPGLTSHRATVTGEIFAGQDALATIDGVRRDALRRNHTGTHLLHAALRTVLGDHVRQQGSLVAPDRLRFDFSHHGAVAPEELAAVARLANADVLTDADVDRGGDLQGRGRGHGGPGLLRRQVRRAGPGGPGRAPLHRAVRRHPRRGPGHDRPDHRHLGVVHRLQHPAHRGRHRHQRPRPDRGPGGAAGRGGRPAAHRARARARGHRPAARAAEGGREGRSSRPAAASSRPRRPRWCAEAVDGVVVARRDGLDPDALRDLAQAVRTTGRPPGRRARRQPRRRQGLAGRVGRRVGARPGPRRRPGQADRPPAGRRRWGLARVAVAGGKDPAGIDRALDEARRRPCVVAEPS